MLLFAISLPASASGQELPSTYPPPGERGTYYLSIQPTDSTSYPDVYPNPEVRDSIDAQHKNHYEAARAIEQYMLSEQNIGFLHPAEGGETTWEQKSRVWNLVLVDGDTIRLDPKAVTGRFAQFFLEYYYQEQELVLFRLLYGKQVDFAVVSRKSGQILDVFGPPSFSPSNNWFTCFNDDGFAGWSPNGLQTFRIRSDSIRKAIEFDMGRSAPGPTGLRWVNETTFQLEMRDHHIVRGGTATNYEHYRINTRKTTN